jgi:hypothetical protein
MCGSIFKKDRVKKLLPLSHCKKKRACEENL